MHDELKSKEENYYSYLLITTLLICSFGLIMVYSSSYIYAQENFGNSLYFLFKQLITLILGVAGAFIVSRVNIKKIFKFSYILHILFSLILTLTLVPGFSSEIKGSKRWLSLGIAQIQPGEFLKVTMVFAALWYFSGFNQFNPKQKITRFIGLIYPMIIFYIQPDFGSFFICSLIILFIGFISPLSRKIYFGSLALSLIGLAIAMISAPYRLKRVMIFLDPWKDPRGGGFQLIQSFLAFANGAIFGQGIGNSNEKLFYLPEAYNDFIFSVIGEELGFLGVVLVVGLFISFIFWGFKIALVIKDQVITQVVMTLTFIIGIQSFLNMSVVLGLIPTKGLNLPFISYGGSSLLANLIIIGLIGSCVRTSKKDSSESSSTISPKRSKSKPFKQIYEI